ncbi:MAG: molybdopterin biosynthesis protein, partial [Chloroflexota bacterium]
DLTGKEVRWVNRQAGSGTRVWLDDQWAAAGIDPEQIQGYEREEATHMGVAQAVNDSLATAGLGIQAAAAAYGLQFIPLTEEHYQLVVPENVWQTPAWEAALVTLRSSAFASAVAELGGYNIAGAGEATWSHEM